MVHRTEMDHVCHCKSIKFLEKKHRRKYPQIGQDFLGRKQNTLTVIANKTKNIEYRNNIPKKKNKFNPTIYKMDKGLCLRGIYPKNESLV